MSLNTWLKKEPQRSINAAMWKKYFTHWMITTPSFHIARKYSFEDGVLITLRRDGLSYTLGGYALDHSTR